MFQKAEQVKEIYGAEWCTLPYTGKWQSDLQLREVTWMLPVRIPTIGNYTMQLKFMCASSKRDVQTLHWHLNCSWEIQPTCKQPSCQTQAGPGGQASHWQRYFLLQRLLGYGPVGSWCFAEWCPSSGGT